MASSTSSPVSNYVPAPVGQAPSYGQYGTSVASLQSNYNAQNAGTAGFTPLKVDGYYGPITQAALNPSNGNNLITTSGTSRTNTGQASTALDSALSQFGITSNQSTTDASGGITTKINPGDTTTGTSQPADVSGTDADPYIQQLQALAANGDATTKLLVQNILASKQTQSNATDAQYDNYKRGLQLLGIQHNDAQSAPELLAGHIQDAENQHQQKLQEISANTNKALADAQTAKDNNDFKMLQTQMNYVKQLQTEKVAELKAYNDTVNQQPTVAKNIASSVYTAMKTLDPSDQQAFIQAVAQQYNLPLGVLTGALVDEQTTENETTVKDQTAQAALDDKNGDTLISVSDAKALGVPYGTTQAQAIKLGITPTTKSTGTTGNGSVTKTGIDTVKSTLIAAEGKDGFTDPYLYAQAYKDWTTKGGSTAGFVAAFPPKKYVNPEATNLPAFLTPPKPKSSSSSRSSSLG